MVPAKKYNTSPDSQSHLFVCNLRENGTGKQVDEERMQREEEVKRLKGVEKGKLVCFL